MSMPLALYCTRNQGSSDRHQVYRDVASEAVRKGLKYIISRSPFLMACLLLSLRPLLISKEAAGIGKGGSANSLPSAAGLTSDRDCLNCTVWYSNLSMLALSADLLLFVADSGSSCVSAGRFRDMWRVCAPVQFSIQVVLLLNFSRSGADQVPETARDQRRMLQSTKFKV